jgi:hypothetical protein
MSIRINKSKIFNRTNVLFWGGLIFAITQLTLPIFASLIDLQLRAVHIILGISLIKQDEKKLDKNARIIQRFCEENRRKRIEYEKIAEIFAEATPLNIAGLFEQQIEYFERSNTDE